MIDPLIGYSAFDRVSDCYEYIENSCYIADTPESLNQFTQECWQPPENYETKVIKFSDIIHDYGVSSGCYIMQSEAMKRWKDAAKESDVKYEVGPFNELFAIRIDYKSQKV